MDRARAEKLQAEVQRRADEILPGKVKVEVVVICDCTNEELEEGKHCARPDCPGRDDSPEWTL